MGYGEYLPRCFFCVLLDTEELCGAVSENGALGVAPARRFTCFVWQSERRVEEGCPPFHVGFAMRGSPLGEHSGGLLGGKGGAVESRA